MNGERASFVFLPWLRRGLSAAVQGGATQSGRLSVPVTVSFGSGRDASTELFLAGPGDVIGLDPRVVNRTWPARDVHDAEPNFFPMLEFGEADLPWRYTPVGAAAGNRIPPWFCLIVLKDEEIAALTAPSGTRRLPVVTVSNAPLPRIDQSWAWVHVQVTGVDSVTPAAALQLFRTESHRLVSRVLCPRRLDANTAYTAFLVPTFESGRRAGIDASNVSDVPALEPAWDLTTTSVQLPVYYSWRFNTGAAGDFEQLVRRLQARDLPVEAGKRNLDVRDPGAQLPSAAQTPLGLEGALRPTDSTSTPWPEEDRAPFITALQSFLNAPADLLDSPDATRAVTAPLYGRWYAAQNRVDGSTPAGWFFELNTDPRLRVAAGLGTQVVQANQRQLMAAAWLQAEGLPDINENLRLAQFSRELSLRIYQRHLPDDDEHVLQLTTPMHARVLASPITIAERLRESPVSDGSVGTVWRRVSRPLGPIGIRQARQPGERQTSVARMNRGALSPAPPPKTAEVLATLSRAGKDLAPRWATSAKIEHLLKTSKLLRPIGLGALIVAAGAVLAGKRLTAAILTAGGAVAIAGEPHLRRFAQKLKFETDLRDGALTPDTIESAPQRADFVATESTDFALAVPQRAAVGRGVGDSTSAVAFRSAASAMLTHVTADVAPGKPPQAAPLAQLRTAMMAALDPRLTVGLAARANLQIADTLVWQPLDPVEPVIAGPDFPQPMYQPLAELSQDWLLPGLDKIPANTITLVETNQRFVEAYMAGLNHEMASELLWREYPSDQRRTCFRQFWDVSGFSGSDGQQPNAELLKDIRPVHQWPLTTPLGENRPPGSTAEQLVILIRGDVLQRYPTLLVYAVRATIDILTGLRVPGGELRQPLFSGALAPDVAFMGFQLTEDEVRGDSSDPGWFFILQEQPHEPRFGLDDGAPAVPPPVLWNDLSWGHLADDEEQLALLSYIDLNSDLPDTTQVVGPSGVAWHADTGTGPAGTTGAQIAYITLQRPVRIAVHANDMLGPKRT